MEPILFSALLRLQVAAVAEASETQINKMEPQVVRAVVLGLQTKQTELAVQEPVGKETMAVVSGHQERQHRIRQVVAVAHPLKVTMA